jgi:hypothetical protein
MTGSLWQFINGDINSAVATALQTMMNVYAQPKFVYDVFLLSGGGSLRMVSGVRVPLVSNFESGAISILNTAGIGSYQHIDLHARPAIDNYFVNYDSTDYSIATGYIDDIFNSRPNITGVWIDAEMNGIGETVWEDFFLNLIAYIRGKGSSVKIHFNTSASGLSSDYTIQAIENAVDGILIENAGFPSPIGETGLTQAIAAAHAGKWIANVWGGAYNSPAAPMSWATVEADTLLAWQNGVTYVLGNNQAIENVSWTNSDGTINTATVAAVDAYMTAVLGQLRHNVSIQSVPQGVSFSSPVGTTPFQLTVNDQGQITVQVPNQVTF